MDKTQFITLLNNLFKIAKKDKWIPIYNRDIDYFSWTKPLLSKDSRLVKVSYDILFYFNPKGLIEGFGIEYLKNNFIEHNSTYKDLPKIFTKRLDKEVYTVPKEKEKEARDTFEMLVETLKADIYEDGLKNKQSIEDLEKLIKSAIKI